MLCPESVLVADPGSRNIALAAVAAPQVRPFPSRPRVSRVCGVRTLYSSVWSRRESDGRDAKYRATSARGAFRGGTVNRVSLFEEQKET